MRISDFDFYLPEELIAQYPAVNRTASRLLHLQADGKLSDSLFTRLPDLLNPGDVLVFNDTRVIKARLFGHKVSGGKVEVLIERIFDEHHALAQIRASKPPKAGSRIVIDADQQAPMALEVQGREADLFLIKSPSLPMADVLEQAGQLPLPPYITHQPQQFDETRYQTVYAKHDGAVAAPTAGLHFDDDLLAQLQNKGVNIAFVTLHVGAGTFQPVRTDNIAEHKMHKERYFIPQETVDSIEQAQKNRAKVVAVGTTALRALESAADNAGNMAAGNAETEIFITPGYTFKVVDKLITNFHLPKSTLLMLVSAFAGVDNIRNAYQHAIAHEYRFFSYGDAMFLEKI